DVEEFADGGAVEDHAVAASLALDHIAAMTGIPLEDIVAMTQQNRVVSLVAVDEVIVVAADEHIRAIATKQRIVTGPSIHGDLDQGCQIAARREGVIAAIGVEYEKLAGADIEEEGSRVETIEAHASAIGRRGETLIPITAVDF